MKTQFPMVSVLIPAYNEEAYIAKALEALLLQDYEHFEVIIVNNASTDRTAQVVSSFIYHKGQTFKFRLLHERRQGTQFARECGRRMAIGSIIAQLDADCIPPPNWISNGVKLLQEGNAVAVAGLYNYFDSGIIVRMLTRFSQLFILQPVNVLVQAFGSGGIIIGGNVFIRADVLEKCGGYNTALRFYGDDVDIALKVSRHGRILFTKKITVKSSARRYKKIGFFQVQAKYLKAFLQSVFRNGLSYSESKEIFHPR